METLAPEKVDLCMYPYPIMEKPKTNKEYAFLQSEILKYTCHLPIHYIASEVGNNGHPMTCAIFNNGIRKNDHLNSIQLFALDFDNKVKDLNGMSPITIEDIKERCELFKLPISFAYETLSSGTCDIPRYRVVFCHYTPIRDIDVARLILRMLLKLFPEADKACKDPCRFFLGGKRLVHVDPTATFRLDQLGYITQQYILAKEMDHFAREVSGLVKDLAIGINEKHMLDIYSNYMPNEHFRTGES